MFDRKTWGIRPSRVKQEREQLLKHIERIRALVDRIDYRPGYFIVVGHTPGMKYPFVQVRHRRPDSVTGEMGVGGGGKAYVSEHMTDTEFFQMVLGLLIAYEQHEVREFFQVDGFRVFHPHQHIEAMKDASQSDDSRKTPTMEVD